jgi:AraC family transcriptional regulator, regulatory protein of adaptative response / methylated-DNA-[protein]-cysteine methyltransferase
MIEAIEHGAGERARQRVAPSQRVYGAPVEIEFSTRKCWLGEVLVATSDKGVCFLAFGEDREALLADLKARFPKARVSRGRDESRVAEILRLVEAPAEGFDFPLDIQGTPFQRRVWAALRETPAGATASYSQIAERIGEPRAVRAVAAACAGNKIAVAIPCHRVLRSDGSLSGYRWGVERKRALLEREAGINSQPCTVF